MPSLYSCRAERVQDVVLAYLNVEGSLRYSLTHGGQFLPYSDFEKQLMREDRAWAMARLVIDKIMHMPDMANLKRFSGKRWA